MQVADDARDALLTWADKRFGKEVIPDAASTPAKAVTPEPEHRGDGIPALVVTDLRVMFGGNVAVDGVTLSVSEREIVGLIGSNGAGKSTLMNAVGGFVPSTGPVLLGDQEIGDRPPAFRAGLGLGRTFQSATLFPELTVTETLLVALEGKREAGVLLSTALGAAAGDVPEPKRPGRGERPGRVSRSRRLPGPLHRRSVDRYPTSSGARGPPCARRQGAVPRRAHGWAGPA